MITNITTPAFVAASAAYTAACAGYCWYIATGHARASRIANRSLVVAGLCHGAFLVADAVQNPANVASIRQTLTLGSLAIVMAQLIALRMGKLSVLGAFVTPVAFLMFLAAGLGHNVPNVPEGVRSVLLPAHVLVNVLGVAAFTLAFAVATAYLIQERLLRRRKLSGLFTRLPPLDVLDSLGLKLLLVGFPLFTLGSVSGAIWAAKLPALSLTPAQMLGLISWVVFGAVLLLRLAAGWQGKRAAIGTLLGFAFAFAVLVGYALRVTGGTT